ncbi:MAG TPA: exopolysaccharide biosynthesis protein, partial [Holophagaceae bacterium]
MPTERLSLFRLLDRRLASEGTVSVGELLDEAGEQTWGLAILLLALLTFIPGVANVLSLGTLALGLQLGWGRQHPWLPASLQRHELQRGHVKALLAQVETRLAWLGTRTAPRRAPGRRTLGLLVTWTAFLAALPVPLPLANVLPALALILFGTALL